MVQLIIYGLLAAGLAFGGFKIWTGFTGQYVAEGKAEQKAFDQKFIDKAEADAAAAASRAEAAEADAAKAVQAAKAQSEALAAAAKLAETAQAAARTAGIKYAAEVAKNAGRQSSLRATAGASPRDGRSCEEVLAATDAILRESQRQRDSAVVVTP